MVLLRQAAVEAHIQAVSIEQILAGRKEGHGFRWACEFTDKHKHTTNSAIQVLRDHCEDAKAAKKLSTTRIQDATEPIDSLLEHLKDHGEAMPTAMMLQILAARAASARHGWGGWAWVWVW